MAARDDELIDGVPACNIRDDRLSDGVYPYTVWDTWLLDGVSVCGGSTPGSVAGGDFLLQSDDAVLLQSDDTLILQGA